MTCILGVYDQEAARCHMAADGRTSLSSNARIISDQTQKILRCGPWLVAFAGDGRALSLLAEATSNIQAQLRSDDPWGFSLVLRELLLADGWQLGCHSGPAGTTRDFGIHALLGSSSGLWEMFSDLTSNAVLPGRVVGIGCGADFGVGAAVVAARHGTPWPDALREGVRLSYEYSTACGGELQEASI